MSRAGSTCTATCSGASHSPPPSPPSPPLCLRRRRHSCTPHATVQHPAHRSVRLTPPSPHARPSIAPVAAAAAAGRFPPHANLFSAMLGVGAQMLAIALGVFALALVGLYYPYNRGALLSSCVVLYALTAGIAGYVSGVQYKQMGGNQWVTNVLLCAVLFCGPLLAIFSVLNTVALAYRSTAALPFGTILIIVVLWALVTFPLTVLGVRAPAGGLPSAAVALMLARANRRPAPPPPLLLQRPTHRRGHLIPPKNPPPAPLQSRASPPRTAARTSRRRAGRPSSPGTSRRSPGTAARCRRWRPPASSPSPPSTSSFTTSSPRCGGTRRVPEGGAAAAVCPVFHSVFLHPPARFAPPTSWLHSILPCLSRHSLSFLSSSPFHASPPNLTKPHRTSPPPTTPNPPNLHKPRRRRRQVYTIYSILFIVFIILVIVTAFITVALTYFQLAAEDHRWRAARFAGLLPRGCSPRRAPRRCRSATPWCSLAVVFGLLLSPVCSHAAYAVRPPKTQKNRWWRAFLCGGSTGAFIFGYCFYYYAAKSDMSGLMQTAFFFGYNGLLCYAFFLMLGAIGFRASALFVRHIYRALKCD